MASYSLIFRTLKAPHTHASVSGAVAAMLNRPHVEVYAMLTLPGFVLFKGLALPDAQARQEELMRKGCVCSLEPEIDIQTGSASSGTKTSVIDADWLSTIGMMVLGGAILAALLTWLMNGVI